MLLMIAGLEITAVTACGSSNTHISSQPKPLMDREVLKTMRKMRTNRSRRKQIPLSGTGGTDR